MPVETAADRAVFCSSNDFGIAATYTVAGGSPVPIEVIKDDDYELLGEAEAAPGIEGSIPQLTVNDDQLPSGVANGDELTIGTTNYKVIEFMPDGTGMTVLRLEISE